jgi:hypothetical protein
MELDFDKRRKVELTQKFKIRLLIAGSRNFNDYGRLETECKDFIRTFAPIQPTDICIISGTANGADKLGEKFANEFGFHVERFPANWDLYGKAAGHIRNEQMAFVANHAIIFWDGQSKGTANMIGLCEKYNINLKVILV